MGVLWDLSSVTVSCVFRGHGGPMGPQLQCPVYLGARGSPMGPQLQCPVYLGACGGPQLQCLVVIVYYLM